MIISEIKTIASLALSKSEELQRLNTEMRVFCTQIVNSSESNRDGFETVLKPDDIKDKYLELRAEIALIRFPTKVPVPDPSV